MRFEDVVGFETVSLGVRGSMMVGLLRCTVLDTLSCSCYARVVVRHILCLFYSVVFSSHTHVVSSCGLNL